LFDFARVAQYALVVTYGTGRSACVTYCTSSVTVIPRGADCAVACTVIL
jgi:hypothetical protein